MKTSHVGGCGGSCAGGQDFRGAVPIAWGNFWAAWVCKVPANPCPAGGITDIWVYLSVDSVVGVRLFLAQPTAFLQTGAGIGVTTPDNVTIPALLDFGAPGNGAPATCPGGFAADCDDTTLDAAVIAALGGANGTAFTAATTDIRAEDAKYATLRALGLPIDTGAGSYHLGYGPGPIGVTIKSGVGGVGISPVVTPVIFGLPGYTDPINTQYTVPTTIKIIPVGESPIVFVANRSNVANGLGQPCTSVGPNACSVAPWFNSYWASNLWDQHPFPPNGVPPAVVTRRPLGNLFRGFDCGTDNAAFQPTDSGVRVNPPSGPAVKITLFLQTPLSGGMNAAEFSEFRRYGTEDGSGPTGNGLPALTSQEGFVVPPPDNPLANKPCGIGFRYRGIETEEVLNGSGGGSGVLHTADSLTYTFFSFGNISHLADNPNFGYLMIDGIDPLFDDYSNNIGGGNAGQPANPAKPFTWGELPTCVGPGCRAAAIWTANSPSCGGGIGCSYPHLRDGTYPAWSVLRLLCDTANVHCLSALDPLGAEGLVENLQFAVHANLNGGVPDLLPFSEAAVGPLSFNPPFGDVSFVREHYNFQAALGNLNLLPTSTHQSDPKVSFKCPDILPAVFGLPVTNIPMLECGGDAGGLIVPAAITPLQTSVSITGAAAPAGGLQVFNDLPVVGPALGVGESIIVTNMPNGDDGTFYITAVGAGTFTVVNPGGIAAVGTIGAGVAGLASAGL